MTNKSVIKINANENQQEVHDPFTGNTMGVITSRVYENEKVQRHMFDNGTRQFSLGPTTDHFQFIDWPSVFEPLLEKGYTPEKVIRSRGGLKMHVVMSNPAGPTYKDPMTWDGDSWGTKSAGLTDSIIISGGLRPGSGINYHRGFFRMICTNGLIVESLGLGNVSFNHANFKPEKLEDALFGKQVVIKNNEIQGEFIGNRKGILKVQKLMKNIQEDGFLASQPSFVKDLLSPIADLPAIFLSEANIQFAQLVASSNKITEMDLSCALTSAYNKMEKPPTRLAFKLLPAQRGLAKLTGVFSIS